MEKVLVTGGSGYMPSIIAEFRQKKYSVKTSLRSENQEVIGQAIAKKLMQKII